MISGAFRNLWAAHTVSSFGTMFGALSLTALFYLEASPTDMAILAAASSVPVVLFATVAGVWIDRLPRTQLMVLADVGRFAVLMTVPLAALLGGLQMEQLWAVAFVTGCLNVVFDIAFRSALPAFVDSDQLVDANSALSAGESVASSASPAIAGALTQALSAPFAVFVDAVTFLVSGVLLAGVRREPRRPPAAGQRSAFQEAVEGVRGALRSPVLRALLAMVATYSFFSGFILTLFGLWIVDGLDFSAVALGVLLGAGGVGALAGAWFARRASDQLGLGRSIVASYVVAAALLFLTPLAGGPMWLAFGLVLVEQSMGDLFWTVHNINAVTMRQTITPNGQLGRVNSTFLVASQGLRPVGALAAGLTAELVGVRAGLFISAAGIGLAGLWLVFSPLIHRPQHGPSDVKDTLTP